MTIAQNPVPPLQVGYAQDDLLNTDHLRADLGGHSIRGAAVTMVSQGTKFALQLASVTILARLLSPSEFGLVSMVAPITGFIALFKDLGLSLATVQRENITHTQVSNLFWINVGASAFLSFVCVGISPLVGLFYGEPRTTWIAAASSAVFLLGGLTAQHQAILSRQMSFGRLGAIDLLSTLGGLIAAVWMAACGWSYWALVAQIIVVALVTCLGVWLASAWRPSMYRRDAGTRSLVSFGSQMTAVSVFGYMGVNIDKLVIGKALGDYWIGIYSRAWSLMFLPVSQVMTPVCTILIPAMSRLASEPERYREAVNKIAELLLLVLTPVAAIAFVASEPIVRIALGPDWLDAVEVFRIFSLVMLAVPLMNIGHTVLKTTGHGDALMRWSIASLVASLAAVCTAIFWGLVAVAYAYVAVEYLVRIPLMLYYVRKATSTALVDLARPARQYGLMFVALVIAGFLALDYSEAWGPTVSLLVVSLGCAGTFTLLIVLLGKHRLVTEAHRMQL